MSLEIIIEFYDDDELIVKGSGFSYESAEEELGKLDRFYQKHLIRKAEAEEREAEEENE